MVKKEADGAIVDLGVAFPRYFVKHDALAAARDVDPAKFRFGLGCEEMTFCGPGEDTVTLAATAAWNVLRQKTGRLERVGLCIVGTESGVDGSKSVASHVHGLLRLPPTCRVFDIQHACYGATAGIQMARAWVSRHPSQLALVIASDIARYERYSAGEPTQGAGAVALLIGSTETEDICLTFSNISGMHASDVYDFWRPTYQKTAVVRGKFSISCYLEGMVAAYEHYMEQIQHEESTPTLQLFHAPFPHMARKAHRRLWEHRGLDPETWEPAYTRWVAPSLWANRRIGNIYTGSVYLSLAALFELEGEALQDRDVALFSYGSGSCSEYFTGRFGAHTATPRILEHLNAREEVDVEQYELLSERSLALESNGSFAATSLQSELTDVERPFIFLGIRDHERVYLQNEADWQSGCFVAARLQTSESIPTVPVVEPALTSSVQHSQLDGAIS